MPHQFDLLPIELQASVVELRAAHVDEATIDTLITRTMTALAVKSNKVQVEVWQMEERLGVQLQQIGNKLQADLRTQHGATNGMLADLHTGVQEAGRGIADLKKQWSELEQWRSRIEAAIVSLTEFRDESTKDRQQIRDAVSAQDTRHGRQVAELIKELRAFSLRLSAIEQLLEIAGQHEAGS
jgi:predicted  nucleic acid-binding Zn-ribbon protein